MTQLMLGFVISAAIAVLAYYKDALNTSGATTATVIGTIIYGFGGPMPFIILMLFFASSALIGRFNDTDAPMRGSLQVLASAGFGAYFVLRYGVSGHQYYLALFLVSLSVSTADTWSSELGRMSKTPSFHPFKLKPMTKGLSGAVSFLGLFAALMGSMVIALTGLVIIPDLTLFVVVIISGFIGALIDSWLGLVQVKFKDEHTARIEDNKTHTNVYHSGFKHLNNTGVNFLSNGIVVLIVYVLILSF